MGRLAVLVVAALSLAAIASAAAPRPDFALTAVTVSGYGTYVRVVDTVRNIGAAAAPASTTGYYVGSTRIGRRPVRRLEPGAASRGSKTLGIPKSIPPGTYRLRACADDTDRVRETSERDNCRAAATRVVVRDRTPPRFAGIARATFCAPGPIGHDRTSRYFLRWEPARDDATPARAIVYDVYESTTSGGESYTSPTYTTRPGATSFETPPLPTDTGRFFVVRARDRAGNRDPNVRERQAVSICV